MFVSFVSRIPGHLAQFHENKKSVARSFKIGNYAQYFIIKFIMTWFIWIYYIIMDCDPLLTHLSLPFLTNKS